MRKLIDIGFFNMSGFAAQSLKPCPFCGCEMQLTTVGRDWVRIKSQTEHNYDCILFESQHDFPYDENGKVMAAKAWNNRDQNEAVKQTLFKIGKEINEETRMSKNAKSFAVAIVLNELGDIENSHPST
jgi:hypothetical protein